MKTKEQLDALAEDLRNRRAELNLARRMCGGSAEYKAVLEAYLKAEAADEEEMEEAGV